MRKQIWIPVAVIAIGAAMAFAVMSRDKQTKLARLPMPDGMELVWPLNQAWTWSFPMPQAQGKKYLLGMVFRAKSSVLPEHISPTFGGENAPMPSAEAEREITIGNLMVDPSRFPVDSGRAAVQILDIAEFGGGSTRPSQPLRLLAKFGAGGTMGNINDDDSTLPTGQLAGWSISSDNTWTDNELYLMRFYIQDDRKLWQYDVFLQEKPDPNP